jgi:signal transduction histidine kinase
MGEMISMIAHQWRQPLSAISSASNLIGLKAKLGKLNKDSVIELTTRITDYTKHLSDTIDDFREFFKPDRKMVKTNFQDIVKSVLNIVNDSIQSRNIEIRTKLECNEDFLTYPNELKQVILNFIKNAEDILIQNHIKEPFICIKSFKDGEYLVIEVSDNGGGVPKEILNKIFEPYFTTKDKNGTGLGLYMSKTIIEEHFGGKLSVYNDDFGAVFKISLKIDN